MLFEGADSSEIAASLAEGGFDDHAIDHLRATITKGSSALFLVAEDDDRGRILEAFGGASRYLQLIHSNLPRIRKQSFELPSRSSKLVVSPSLVKAWEQDHARRARQRQGGRRPLGAALPPEHGSETVGTYLTEGLSDRARDRAEATLMALDELLPRVQKEANDPDVRPVGMSFEDVGTIRLTQPSSAGVTAKVIRADEPPKG